MRKSIWLVFALVFLWKVLLFFIAAQPVPANDSFFYDGAVIHKLIQGGFYNPALAQAFPICGTQIFSGYPPLYHLPLYVWMSLFGTSAFSAMGFHIVLFGLYLLVLLAILRRLKVPTWCVNVSGFFLLTFTFHDRPDSLAQLLGISAVYAFIRSHKDLATFDSSRSAGWTWLMAALNILTFCTSLQIGEFYLMVVWILMAADWKLNGAHFPLVATGFTVGVLIASVLTVKFATPLAWAGFLEHLRQTPSLTQIHLPHGQDLLKIGRTVPGIFVATLFLIYGWLTYRLNFSSLMEKRLTLILAACLAPCFAIIGACLIFLTPNMVAIPNYLQVLIVAASLALVSAQPKENGWLRLQVACLIPAILLGSIRALGMSTWGLACAQDVSYWKAVKMVDAEITGRASRYEVVLSSAFLYGAAPHTELNLIHSDWLAIAHGDSLKSDSNALLKLRPSKIILTQFDYFRRYRDVLKKIESDPSVAEIQIINSAHVSAPDSFNSVQKVVQNISWAPVIINLTWRKGT